MKTIILFEITRKEIHALDFSRFLARFGRIPVTSKEELLLHNDAVVLSISGFESEPDELYAIPLVREYFQRLHSYWPFWLYFLHLAAEPSAIPILSLLPTVSVHARRGTGRVAARFEPSEMGDLLLELFPHMNLLCDRVGLGEDYIERRTRAILRRFLGEGADL